MDEGASPLRTARASTWPPSAAAGARTNPRTGAGRRWVARHERSLIGGATIGACLVAWEAAGRTGLVSRIFFSHPSAILAAGLQMWGSGELAHHLRVSAAEFALGFLLAVAIGVPLGLGVGWVPRLAHAVEPLLNAFYATPRVAFLPLLVLWLGIGLWSKVAVVLLGALLPVAINTAAGVRTVSHVHLRVARSFRAGQLHVIRTIVLPTSVPFLIAGLRLGIGRALVGIVVGELHAADAGIGFLIATAGATYQIEKVFVGIAVLAAFGITCNEVLARAEARVERWRLPAGRAR